LYMLQGGGGKSAVSEASSEYISVIDKSAFPPDNSAPRPRFEAVFSPAFTTFNAMQSQLVDRMLSEQHESVVVSAPTGTGKTAVFEMAVLSLFVGSGGQGKGHKAVYLAPSKFLVMQKAQVVGVLAALAGSIRTR
jgi:replicative superfamily II helicase